MQVILHCENWQDLTILRTSQQLKTLLSSMPTVCLAGSATIACGPFQSLLRAGQSKVVQIVVVVSNTFGNRGQCRM